MLWVLKWAIEMRRFFWRPKHMLQLIDKEKSQFLRSVSLTSVIMWHPFHEMQFRLHCYTVISSKHYLDFQRSKTQLYTSWVQTKICFAWYTAIWRLLLFGVILGLYFCLIWYLDHNCTIWIVIYFVPQNAKIAQKVFARYTWTNFKL